MNECVYFPTWEEKKDVMISLDEKTIDIPFAKERFNLSKSQEWISHDIMEVRLEHSLDYDRVYSGTLKKIKGSSVHSQSKEEFNEYQNKYPRFTEDFEKLYMTDKVEFREIDRTDWIRYKQSASSDPILAKLCELKGAKMYGDYIILKNEVGAIYHITGSAGLTREQWSFIDEDGLHHNRQKDISTWQDAVYSKYTNIFYEYSKFLRGEENKFEEVRKVLGI